MKVAVVYFSGTGNTEIMADAVCKGITSAGADVSIIPPREFTKEISQNFDAIAFGCPSMGGEELEEEVFEPMFEAVLPALMDKRIALFGSYGWGDGEWMRLWFDRTRNAGVSSLLEPVIANEIPSETDLIACRALGKEIVSKHSIDKEQYAF